MSTTTTEIVEKVEQVKVASGFAKRNANKQRIEEEEAELAELLKAREESPETTEEQQQADDDPEPESAEEKTFKGMVICADIHRRKRASFNNKLMNYEHN